jgi:hypothetical protein
MCFPFFFLSCYYRFSLLPNSSLVMCEKTEKFNLNIYMVFINYKKAWNCVACKFVLQTPKNKALKRNTLNNKDDLQSKLREIKMDSEGEKLRLEREVKQGDPISPELLMYLLELIFRKRNWSNICGLNINCRKLTNLKFAYDRFLFAKSNGELQEIKNELTKLSTIAGLKINAKIPK